MGKIPAHCVHHAGQEEKAHSTILGSYGCPVAPLLNRICSCCLFLGGVAAAVVGVGGGEASAHTR